MALLRECRRCKKQWNPKKTSRCLVSTISAYAISNEDIECCEFVLRIPRDSRKGAYYWYGETDPAEVKVEDDLCQVCARLLVKWLDNE